MKRTIKARRKVKKVKQAVWLATNYREREVHLYPTRKAAAAYAIPLNRVSSTGIVSVLMMRPEAKCSELTNYTIFDHRRLTRIVH